MPNLKTGKDCCGCTACEAICPHNAISMQPDSLGFRYPIVDIDKCVECKLCERVCAFNETFSIPENFQEPETYGVRLKDEHGLMESRSGGAFTAFSDWIIDNGGVVYGVGFRDHFTVCHKRAENKKERNEFRGSKYVQSDMSGILRLIRKDLVDGRKALFTGTPCQTSAVYSFIPNKLHSNLWLIDIVCHGTPSPVIWQDYIKYLEAKENSKLTTVNFRDKKHFGWKASVESYDFGNGNKLFNNGFTYLFSTDITLRKSCGNCHFCNLHRPSDLTLADFWGWERTGSNINDDDKGLSLVLINSQKGQQLFHEVASKLIVLRSTIAQSMQSHLEKPTVLNPRSNQFQIDYERKGFTYVYQKYGNEGWRYKVRSKLSFGKRMIKSILGIGK